MAAGGRRPGAGRPRGVTAGTKHARLEKMLGKGSKTPLEYMLNILNIGHCCWLVTGAPHIVRLVQGVILKKKYFLLADFKLFSCFNQ